MLREGLEARREEKGRNVTPQLRQAAKRELIRQIEQGASVREARGSSVVPMHRTTVYRLLKRAQSEGEQALSDGRHGHPVKLRGEVLYAEPSPLLCEAQPERCK